MITMPCIVHDAICLLPERRLLGHHSSCVYERRYRTLCAMQFVLSRGGGGRGGGLINLFDARLVSSFASTLPDFLAGNRKFKINHSL